MNTGTTPPALQLSGLHAWYGEAQVLHGIDLELAPGQVAALLGRNGAGRTTTLRAILGLVGRRGSIRIDGVETSACPTHRIAHHGIGYCPEERGIFASLDCEENLLLPPAVGAGRRGRKGRNGRNGDAGRGRHDGSDGSGGSGPAGMSLDEIYALFPNLRERRASPGTRLSGGEQQMLAIARVLRTGAHILLLDEISEGLAPVIVQALARLIDTLKRKGYTILMVEQNFRFAAPLADRFFVMEQGRIVDRFESGALASRAETLAGMLAV